MLTEDEIYGHATGMLNAAGGIYADSVIDFARAIESAVRAELMRGEFICHKCGIRQDAPKPDVSPF